MYDISQNGNKVYICPVNNEPCQGETCPLYLELEDWQGCSLDVASQGIQIAGDMLKKAARWLDTKLKKS